MGLSTVHCVSNDKSWGTALEAAGKRLIRGESGVIRLPDGASSERLRESHPSENDAAKGLQVIRARAREVAK